jgi:hypothetical protein
MADGVGAAVTMRYTESASASDARASPPAGISGSGDGRGLRDGERYWKTRPAGLGGIFGKGGRRFLEVLAATARSGRHGRDFSSGEE